ncbi:hypothetical protein ACHWQZ_G009395 [Mnemiopsis leidyi]
MAKCLMQAALVISCIFFNLQAQAYVVVESSVNSTSSSTEVSTTGSTATDTPVTTSTENETSTAGLETISTSPITSKRSITANSSTYDYATIEDTESTFSTKTSTMTMSYGTTSTVTPSIVFDNLPYSTMPTAKLPSEACSHTNGDMLLKPGHSYDLYEVRLRAHKDTPLQVICQLKHEYHDCAEWVKTTVKHVIPEIDGVMVEDAEFESEFLSVPHLMQFTDKLYPSFESRHKANVSCVHRSNPTGPHFVSAVKATVKDTYTVVDCDGGATLASVSVTFLILSALRLVLF